MAPDNRRRSPSSHVLERTAIMNTQMLLEYLLTCYPILLMLLFVVVCVTRMVVKSKTEQKGSQNEDGQLPRRTRNPMAFGQTKPFSGTVKHCFNWLSAGVLVTFFVDATVYITHVLTAHSEYRWRGQSVGVRLYSLLNLAIVYLIPADLYRRLYFCLRRYSCQHTGYHPFPDGHSAHMLVLRRSRRAYNFYHEPLALHL
jgi:hypothetical protein